MLRNGRINDVAMALEQIGGRNLGQCRVSMDKKITKPTLYLIRDHDKHFGKKPQEIVDEYYFPVVPENTNDGGHFQMTLPKGIKVYGLKSYTKTILKKRDGKYYPTMLGVIEGPVNKMMKAYPQEFSFMRHQTKRDLRPSARSKNEKRKES